MACGHDSACFAAAPSGLLDSPRWRRALWIALFINAGFLVGEIVAGAAAGSAALQTDTLDFFGDAADYSIRRCVRFDPDAGQLPSLWRLNSVRTLVGVNGPRSGHRSA
jgi:hypothetical protein